MSGDDATGRLSDGITEDIITDLARFRDLDVIARNSTDAYKGKSTDIRQVGRELGVRYVLEGSVQRQGERIRVTAQLIDAANGDHVWAERWDRPVGDVFALQTELAEQVANRLGGYAAVEQAERTEAKRKRPENLSAYELYLLGTETAHRFTPQDSEVALQVLRQAVEADPKLARAWTALAWANLISTNGANDPAPLIQAALGAGQRAMQLDPADAEAHAVVGEAQGLSGDLEQAKIQYEWALSLNPGSADILTFYSGWAADFGDPSAGMEAADKAIRLDPNFPVWAASVYFAYAYFVGGRYDDSLKMVRRVPPENRSIRDFVIEAGSLAMLGRQQEARAAMEAALTHQPGLSAEEWAGSPMFSEATRQKFLEAMRRAEFPLCASPDLLRSKPELKRLPECLAS